MNYTAPIELSQMGLDVATFTRADDRSWRGACPMCGGSRRFLVFVDRPWPSWNWSCDGCGAHGFADQLNRALKQPLSEAQRAEYAQRQAEDHKRREQRRMALLETFTDTEIYAEHHRRMTNAHRQHWRDAGISDYWQDYWRLGFMVNKGYRSGGELHYSPAMTIPYFHTGWQFQTMQYRLLDPARPADRYRFQHNLSHSYFQTNPEEPIGDRVIVCEGAKKAMVVCLLAPPDYTVLAVAAKNTAMDLAPVLSDCERVWVMLDPDADLWARRLCKAVGDAARLVTLPGKADDMVTQHGAVWDDIAAFMKQGGRA